MTCTIRLCAPDMLGLCVPNFDVLSSWRVAREQQAGGWLTTGENAMHQPLGEGPVVIAMACWFLCGQQRQAH